MTYVVDDTGSVVVERPFGFDGAACGGGDDQPRVVEIVVPAGTFERLQRGEDVAVMPAEIRLRPHPQGARGSGGPAARQAPATADAAPRGATPRDVAPVVSEFGHGGGAGEGGHDGVRPDP